MGEGSRSKFAEMSLKAFHIVFVAVSMILCAGFGYWALSTYQEDHEPGLLVAALFSLAGCVALIVYGRWFLKKLKGVGYL